MKLVDSHCHLDDEKFDADREQAIERALAAGVETMLAIDAPEFAERHPFLYATVGVHPHEEQYAQRLAGKYVLLPSGPPPAGQMVKRSNSASMPRRIFSGVRSCPAWRFLVTGHVRIVVENADRDGIVA